MNHTPVRKITNRGVKKNTGVFPSVKNERLIGFESLIELDYIYLLEYDEDVISYKEQPFTIAYHYLDKLHKYTPDLLVYRKNQIELIEVKPQNKFDEIWSDELQVCKYKAAAKYCKYNGISEFKIVTDKDMHRNNLLQNVKYLFSFHNLIVPDITALNICNELRINGPQQIINLLFKINNYENLISTYYAYILAMIYRHEIAVDLLEPVNRSSFVWLNSME